MILDEIVTYKRSELAEQQARVPLAEVRARAEVAEPPRDFAAALRGEGVRLIAEIKKASPVKGVLLPNLDPVALARTYATAGASAISVLTDEHFFQGRLEFLGEIRAGLAAAGYATPLLRKDFLFDPYQVYEARAAGADAILLIVAILDQAQLTDLLDLAAGLGLTALVETHDATEVERALAAGARVIGINNRDLRSFTVDLSITQRLRRLIPSDRLVVSESGISRPDDVARLAAWGVDAMLVGESLVTAPDIGAKVADLLAAGRGLRQAGFGEGDAVRATQGDSVGVTHRESVGATHASPLPGPPPSPLAGPPPSPRPEGRS